ncbi:hypothetical protein LRX75_22660 [Rhizobium sp. DKSPLA3]|uniref:Uncharacterized protein n=1 Tax=Rhizobium quercicola TaxID=2901226 RepID=A0A9X1NWM0_9HYPH|nr:hypothetical protein [Rhizobium quercicola]MCD7111833.1 hypothetical protein [Rhizobium quercicola]
MNEKSSHTTVAMPLSVTDILTAVEKVMGILEKTVGYVGATNNAIQRYKGRKVADAVDTLAFKSDGSRKHLEAIAAGKGDLSDFEGIATRMDQTGEDVEEALELIEKSRRFIRQRFGLAEANRLNGLIYSGGGKASIRLDLYMLARMEDPHFSADEVAADAQRILDNIQSLNAGLEQAHDMLIELKKRDNG